MNKLKEIIKSKGDDTFERAMRRYGIVPKDAEILYKNIIDDTSSEEGNSDSVLYLKVLDVNTGIDGTPDTTLTYNSPKIKEFFSDAWSLGAKDYMTQQPMYSIEASLGYAMKIAVEAKKKELGKPNVYDSLQKRVPILAIRTKELIQNGELIYPEKLLILGRDFLKYDDRIYGSADGDYGNTIEEEEGYPYGHPTCVIEISAGGLQITNIE